MGDYKMEDNKKDKLIIGLIIAVVALLANTFINNYTNNSIDQKQGFFESEEQIEFEDKKAKENDKDITEISELKVHISGEVNQEGVYTFNEGDRLDDLIKIAGGLTSQANTDSLNLAMKLEDQMKIYIPNINEPVDEVFDNQALISDNSNNTNKININEADKDELMTLPNIGEKRAEAIIEYRQTHKFENIEDIKNVTGIGDKFFDTLKDLIRV